MNAATSVLALLALGALMGLAWWTRRAVRMRRAERSLARIVDPDGRARSVEAHGSVGREQQGGLMQRAGLAQDLGERTRAEDRLREASERPHLALDAERMGTFDWDVPGDRITWSRRHEELWGFAPGEFAGTYEAFASRVHPDDMPKINAAVSASIVNRAPFVQEFRVILPDGTRRWILGRGEFRFGPSGQPLRMLGVVVDVTDRKQAEEALRASEERFRTLVDGLTDGITIISVDGRHEYVNPAACAMFGYPREEFLQLRASDVVMPDERPLVAQALHAVSGGQPYPREWRFRRRDGSTFIGEVNARMLPDGRVIGVTRDITERKRSEDQLREYASALRALTERIQNIREEEGKRIARELHDELGQWLTGLRMDVAWIDKRLRAFSGGEPLGEVRRKIATMTGQIDATIEAVRRISSEVRPPILDDLGLVAAIDWQAQEFHKRYGIRCATTLPDEVEIPEAHATALYRILLEALTNVARHAQAKNVAVTLTRENDRLRLEVTDDGAGIKGGDPGRSLGILGMRERAAALGGIVSIEPAGERGTRVTVLMPIRHQASSSVS